MDIDAILRQQSGPAVLLRAVDAEGHETDDLASVVDADVLIPQGNAAPALVPLRRLVEQAQPVSIRS